MTKLIDIVGIIKHETERSILVDTGNKEDSWLPKSLVDWHRAGQAQEGYIFTMPEWLAKDKELI